MSKNNSAYIITGAPGTGKSTIIESLEDLGLPIFEEIARKVIAQEVKKGTNALPWIDVEQFSLIVLDEMLAQKEAHLNLDKSFLDRGIPDIIGYLNHGNITPDPIFEKYLSEFNYNKKVFFTPIWEEIYKNDTERIETLEQAHKISEALFSTYQNLGFEMILVPKVSIEKRVEFILSETD